MICEFMHHLIYLQHFSYAKKYTECHKVCSAPLRCIATSLRLHLDVCKATLSPGPCCGSGAL